MAVDPNAPTEENEPVLVDPMRWTATNQSSSKRFPLRLVFVAFLMLIAIVAMWLATR